MEELKKEINWIKKYLHDNSYATSVERYADMLIPAIIISILASLLISGATAFALMVLFFDIIFANIEKHVINKKNPLYYTLRNKTFNEIEDMLSKKEYNLKEKEEAKKQLEVQNQIDASILVGDIKVYNNDITTPYSEEKRINLEKK